MQENIKKIKTNLEEIFKDINNRLMLEQMDIEKLDEAISDCEADDDQELKQIMLEARERIVKSKNDKSFWENDIPELISLLETSKERIQNYQTDTVEIGDKSLSNNDIVNLLRQKILTPEITISKTHKGKEFMGNLTADGYLKLEIHGNLKKLSLRQAALHAWGTDPQNQWAFWEAPDNNGEKKPLEYFRKLLK